MELDRGLNLVISVERSDGVTVYVHSTPISRDVFKQFYRVIWKTFTALYENGAQGAITSTRVAGMMLREFAAQQGQAQAVETGLFAEIRRLSDVIVPSDRGWVTAPFYDAVERGVIDADDMDEVENIVSFFIVNSAMLKKRERDAILTDRAENLGWRTTSSNSTAFAASLTTSTPVASSGERAPPSLIPS